MRIPLTLFAVLLAAMAATTTVSARRDLPSGAAIVPRAEVVVFEVAGCAYCELFRRDVWPGYRSSPRHAVAPLRFVDVKRTDLGEWPLAAPLTIVPTVVLMRDGREVGRITGYAGPETFYQHVRHLLAASGE